MTWKWPDASKYKVALDLTLQGEASFRRKIEVSIPRKHSMFLVMSGTLRMQN